MTTTLDQLNAEIASLRQQLADRRDATPNLRDFGLEPNQRAAYEAAMADWNAESARLAARYQAAGYERLAIRQAS